MSAAFHIAQLSVEIVLYYWFALVLLSGLAAVALFFGRVAHLELFRRRIRSFALAYVLPACVVIIGATLRYEHAPQSVYHDPPLLFGVALWAPAFAYAVFTVAAAVVLRNR